METKSINNYGYDRQTYNSCLDHIRDTNRRHSFILNTWFLIMSLLFMVIRTNDSMPGSRKIFPLFNMNGLDRAAISPIWVFVLFFILALILEFYLVLCNKWPVLNIHALPYFNILLMGLYSIFISIVQPSKPAIMFPVIIVLVSVMYIDTMLRMLLCFVILNAAFIITSVNGFLPFRFQAKPFSIAYEDIFNMALFLFLCITLHYYVQRTRMRQYVLYRKNLEITRELSINSSFDALTTLLNRGRFMTMASEIIRSVHDEYMVLVLLDLDRFKQINDKLGHQIGDKALQITGRLIISSLSDERGDLWSFPERAVHEKLTFAGRLGGDEFILLMRGMENEDAVRARLNAFLDSLNHVEFGELHGIHSSIGVTEISPDENDIDRAYNHADEALYVSKEAGRNQITFAQKGA